MSETTFSTAAEWEVVLYGVVTGCRAVACIHCCTIVQMANNMLIGQKYRIAPDKPPNGCFICRSRVSSAAISPDKTCQVKFSDKALLTNRPQSASGRTKDTSTRRSRGEMWNPLANNGKLSQRKSTLKAKLSQRQQDFLTELKLISLPAHKLLDFCLTTKHFKN